jgi:polysaccharide export outer membrane protein
MAREGTSMLRGLRTSRLALCLVALVTLADGSGCRSIVSRPQPRLTGRRTPAPPGESCVPTEKEKSTLPSYVIEPPDILFIEALRLVPKPPYHIQAGDELALVIEPDDASVLRSGRGYFVDPEGRLDLGPRLGKVKVAKLTVEQAEELVVELLKEELRDPSVSVSVMQTGGLQPISGEHLVSPDGTVNLGTYGLVYVAGMTLPQAKTAIEEHLSAYLDSPQISASVFAYNSKVYYVVTQGGPSGDQVNKLPVTGNETVLDAIANIQGLSRLSSKNIWIARPTPGGMDCELILPVSWKEITAGAGTATNYQILPGDRIFVAENRLVALDGTLQQIIAPFERVFGVSLLGTQTVQTINRFPLGLSGLSNIK